jgi:DNA-directed RNA polymerase subunit RPC12/RpoP
MASEHRILTWILRGGGFLMMFIGLNLFFGPINAVLDFIPFLGNVGRSIIGLAMLLVAVVLSLLTIIVSIVAHNIFFLLGAAVVVLFVIWIVGQMRAKPELAMVSARPAGPSSASAERSEQMSPDDEEEATQKAAQSREPLPERTKFACEECGKKYAVKRSIAGRKVNCKQCDHPLVIPHESTL